MLSYLPSLLWWKVMPERHLKVNLLSKCFSPLLFLCKKSVLTFCHLAAICPSAGESLQFIMHRTAGHPDKTVKRVFVCLGPADDACSDWRGHRWLFLFFRFSIFWGLPSAFGRIAFCIIFYGGILTLFGPCGCVLFCLLRRLVCGLLFHLLPGIGF